MFWSANPAALATGQQRRPIPASQIMFDKVEAFYRPANVREALRLLQSGKGRARVVAGGTDVVVDGDDSVRFLIDITHAGLSYIRRRGTACVIGATTTMAELEASDVIQALAGGLLCRAARTCGSVPIRNRATLGGNLANGSPAADMASPLLVLDAEVVMADARGRRKLPLAEYLPGCANMRVGADSQSGDGGPELAKRISGRRHGLTAVGAGCGSGY